MYGFHHQLEDGIEDLPRLFGISIGEQLHRAFQVCEEDVICLRSPSSAAFDVRMRSARCLGVYVSGVANRAASKITRSDDSGRPHRRQKLSSQHLRCRTEDTRR